MRELVDIHYDVRQHFSVLFFYKLKSFYWIVCSNDCDFKTIYRVSTKSLDNLKNLLLLQLALEMFEMFK